MNYEIMIYHNYSLRCLYMIENYAKRRSNEKNVLVSMPHYKQHKCYHLNELEHIEVNHIKTMNGICFISYPVARKN